MRVGVAALTALALVAAAPLHAASTLYRVVNPDGTVIYTNERLPGAQPVDKNDVPPPPPVMLPPSTPADTAPPPTTQGASQPHNKPTPAAPKPTPR